MDALIRIIIAQNPFERNKIFILLRLRENTTS